MAVFACTPSLSGSGTGLIGVHADGSVTDLGSYSIDFGSPTDWISTLHDGKLYYVPGSATRPKPSRSPTLPPKLPRRSRCLLAVAGTIIASPTATAPLA